MVAELIDKLVWIVQTLVNAGPRGLTYRELSRKWEDRFGSPYPRRTFNNHREEIAEVFGIETACNRSTNCYYIESGAEALDKNDTTSWMINTFTVRSLLALSRERLSGRVSVEDIPSGQRFLTPLMEAMVASKEVCFEYRKYGGGEPDARKVRPYALKELHKRWYLIGYDINREDIRVYGLDRIMSMETSGDTFKLPDGFDVDRLFEDSFGIYLFNGAKPEIIRLKADEKETAYLTDLPLHHSQRLEKTGPGYNIFRLFVIPDDNLIMELCSHGKGLEVIEPQHLRQKVAGRLKETLDRYLED